MNSPKQLIETGQVTAGIEFGSTRVKLVLIDSDCHVLATGGYTWESSFVEGYWTYSIDEVKTALQTSYKHLKDDVLEKYGVTIKTLSGFGISGMMHGYLPVDASGTLLTGFRTWRNTTTSVAADELTNLFQYPIPERWSVSHFYQAILNQETHIKDVYKLHTLATYVHYLLTGKHVAGIGEASGMFPVDTTTLTYNKDYIEKFRQLTNESLLEKLPEVRTAGEAAGTLTEEGALLIDPSGDLMSGIPFCPPEGDAGTGMIATNAIKQRTGNISAGTSVFAMLVLEEPLGELIPNIDLVTTPHGNLVAMVHSNNCTADSNQWIQLLAEVAQLIDPNVKTSDLYEPLYQKALEGAVDGGGLLHYGYVSGEHITNIHYGRPLFVRKPDAEFTLANFMRTQLYSAVATLKIGMEPLLQKGLTLESLIGHGGLFKTKKVGQQIMADALNTNIHVMEHSGEGGAWGIAVLAQFLTSEQSLEEYLNHVFEKETYQTVAPDPLGVEGFQKYLETYQKGLVLERNAEDTIE